jgi:O-antigen/teichoic acid export membrane protein
MKEITIGKRTIIWSYLATILQIGSGVLLFPVILKLLPSEMIGIWSIFMAITIFVNMLDFGFTPSFTRNITYIFSGINKLEKTGIATDSSSSEVNYALLSGSIKAMKWFYLRIALLALVLLSTVGSIYLFVVLKSNYHADVLPIWIAWGVFCFTNTYNIYTLYYDCLLLGRGLVKKDKQSVIISQLLYLGISLLLILCGCGLISIVIGQAIALLVKRQLSSKFFYSNEIKTRLSAEKNNRNFKDIINVIIPNSIKLGLTGLGGFLSLQSSVFIGSLYLTLNDMASYGITVQVVNVIASLGGVYYFSHTPKIAQLRVSNNIQEIKALYFKSTGLLLLSFFSGGLLLILLGNWALSIIGSKTLLLQKEMLFGLLLITFLEKNHAIAGGFLLSKNEVPFFRASIAAGLITVALLVTFFIFFDWGIWTMILAPGIAQIIYQNWRWPYVLLKDLNAGKK